jgi:protein TonB
VGDGKGLVEAPKKEEDDADKVFIKVEQESQFPGGPAAWLRFLNKTLRYPDDAVNNEITGRVVVRFIVDKDGNVSDVEAVSGPEQGGLREEAVRVIKKSGKWTPAMQNGRQVKSYKQQPVTFEMPHE